MSGATLTIQERGSTDLTFVTPDGAVELTAAPVTPRPVLDIAGGPPGPQGAAAMRGFTAFCSENPRGGDTVAAGESPYAFTITEAECSARAIVAATDLTVHTVYLDGTEIGTFTWQAGETQAVAEFTGFDVPKDGFLTIVATIGDATIAGITYRIIS